MPNQRTPARLRLIRAADSTLFERGIRATPVDELLRLAEASAATLYAHFGSKDALVAEALRLRLTDWRAAWDQHVIAASDDTSRLLAVFDALATYRHGQQAPARWCAFLATSTELADATDEIKEVLAADTALLTERLVHLAQPLAGTRARDLADEVLLTYDGVLTGFLRGHLTSPIDVGRRLARTAVQAYVAD